MNAREYIKLVVRAGEALQEVRDAELRAAPHPRAAIEALSEAFRLAIRESPPAPTSGLVEYQRLIARLGIARQGDGASSPRS